MDSNIHIEHERSKCWLFDWIVERACFRRPVKFSLVAAAALFECIYNSLKWAARIIWLKWHVDADWVFTTVCSWGKSRIHRLKVFSRQQSKCMARVQFLFRCYTILHFILSFPTTSFDNLSFSIMTSVHEISNFSCVALNINIKLDKVNLAKLSLNWTILR